MGKFKGILASGVMLILIAMGVFGIAKVNNINDIQGVYEWLRNTGQKASDCGLKDVTWRCLPGDSDNSGSKSKDSSKPKGEAEKAVSDTNKDKLLASLDKLSVSNGDDNVVYKRSDWKHWIGSPCNTRETVLKTQGDNVKVDSDCRALSGTWTEPYKGKVVTDAKSLDIDHVIPLGYAAKHGGNAWSSEKKQQFANDLTQLLAVDGSANRSKSDKGPGDYMPENRDFRCTYAKLWVNTASKYGISISDKDKSALKSALQKCSN